MTVIIPSGMHSNEIYDSVCEAPALLQKTACRCYVMTHTATSMPVSVLMKITGEANLKTDHPQTEREYFQTPGSIGYGQAKSIVATITGSTTMLVELCST